MPALEEGVHRGILFCVIISLLGIANHYTLALHGSLLTVEQFQNARTALSVIGSYNLLSDNLLPGLFVQLAFLAGGILLSWGNMFCVKSAFPPCAGSVRCVWVFLCCFCCPQRCCSSATRDLVSENRAQLLGTSHNCAIPWISHGFVLRNDGL